MLLPGTSMHIIAFAALLCLAAGVAHGDNEGTRWASAALEAEDEKNDAEILRAVVTSMAEYHLRKFSSHRKKRADASVCYPDVGCFQDSGPFGYLDMLPSPPEEVDTHFLLYSRRNRGDVPLLDVPFNNLSMAWQDATRRFNASSATKIIVHGFGSSCNHVWVYEMRSALMAVDDCNVICIDWEKGAAIPNYVRAAANTRLVGKQVAMLLAGLQKHAGLPVHKVHVIGFSLGAHVAGFAGAELKNLSRITGLDPAGPLFESQDPRARLDATDATFVDVIHSNGENLILGGLGTRQPLGHVDFYPNGGRMQKGCTNLFVGAVSDILWSASENEARSLCNHRRAYKFFTDSVSPRCHFPAAPCDSYEAFLQGRCFPCDARSCGNMGYYADRSQGRGALYLVTRDEEPFCAHQYHVRVESSPSVLPVVSYGKIQITLIGDSEMNETFTLTQKDDEQLQVGGSLSRIVVPHPVMQEPRGVQILYTAYSGWLSSGLTRWSVDKVTLSDSFGKSSSVCKKDLVLESGVPITLPLFAGECNPPRDRNPGAASVPTSVSSDTNEVALSHLHAGFNLSLLLSNSSHKFIPTQVVHVGDEGLQEAVNETEDPLDGLDSSGPAWQPLLDFPENSNNGNGLENVRNRDDARAFNDQVPTTNQPLNTSNTDRAEKHPVVLNKEVMATNLSTTTAVKPEISEPVLIPSPSTAPEHSDRRSFQKSGKPEITEPVLKPSMTPATSENPDTLVVATKVEPVGRDLTEKSQSEYTPAVELNPPPLGANIWEHWPPAKGTRISDKENRRSANSSRSFFFDKDTSHPPPPPVESSSERSITVQLLPQRLVALLEQAERYARLAVTNFFGSRDSEIASMTMSSTAPDNKNSASAHAPQRRAKNFGSISNHRSRSSTSMLVPLSYSNTPRYIPLTAPKGKSTVS